MRKLILVSALLVGGCSSFAGEPVKVTGKISEEGGHCVTLRSASGELYALSGKTRRFFPGDPVEVTGRFAVLSDCPVSPTIIVEEIHPAATRSY